MSDNVIPIVFEGVDKTKDTIEGITDSIGGLASLAAGALTVGLAAGAAGAVALGAGLKFAIGEALEAEKTQASLAQVIKSTGGAAGLTADAANKLAMQFRDLAGGSDDAVLAIEEIGLRAGTISADQMPKFIQTTLDLGKVMGSATAAAELLARAQENPMAAYKRIERSTGAYNLELEKQITKLQKAGKSGEATALIMAELAKTTGGAAAADAQTLSGRWEILQGHLAEAGETIGNALLPILSDLFDNVIAPAIPFVEDLAQAFSGVVEAIKGGGDIGDVLDTLAEFDSIQSILGVLGLTTDQFRNLGDQIKSFTDSLKPIGDAVGNVFSAFSNNDPDAFFKALDKLGEVFGKWATDLWKDKIQPGMIATMASISAFIEEKAPDIEESVKSWREAFFSWLGAGKAGAGGEADPIKTKITEIANSFLNESVANAITLTAAGLNMATAFLQGAAPKVGPMLEALGTWLGETIAWIITTAVPQLALAGIEMSKALAGWITTDLIPGLGPSLTAFNTELDNFWLNTVIPGLIVAGTSFVKALSDGITAGMPSLRETNAKIIAELQGAFDGAKDKFIKLGSNMLDNIRTGIMMGVAGLISAVEGVVKDAIAAAGRALGNAVGGGGGGGGTNSVASSGTRDSGGPGVAGKTYLIGAGAQPELFTPSTNGTFTPNASVGGGGPQTILVNLVTSAGETLAQVRGEARAQGWDFVQVA